MNLVPYTSSLNTWQNHKPDTSYKPFHVIQSGRGFPSENGQVKLVNPNTLIVERAKSKLKKRINTTNTTKRLQSSKRRRKTGTAKKKTGKSRKSKTKPKKRKAKTTTKTKRKKKTTKRKKSS